MENVDRCPWCRGEDSNTLARLTFPDRYLDLIGLSLDETDREWRECDSCGFVYADPRLTLQEQDRLYALFRDEDFRGESADEYFDRLTSLPEEKATARWKASFVHSELRKERVRSILDVGCGGGILLYRMRSFFPDARLMGLEPNAAYAEMVERRLGVEVVPDFSSLGLRSDGADLALCTNVLEHVTDFRGFFAALRDLVIAGGFLFLEVPSVECFGVIAPTKEPFAAPHLYFFPKKRLIELAEDSGFTLRRYALHRREPDGINDNYLFQKRR